MNVLVIILLAGIVVLQVILLLRKQAPDPAALRESREEAARNRDETARHARELREEVSRMAADLRDSLFRGMAELSNSQAGQMARLVETTDHKLDAMRRAVDERLQGTLERRLGESFRLVSERLELVHKGLGEMQALATGVGDLKKVLTNVRARGAWGEVMLGALLEEVLAPDQYERNVAVTGGAERVEFAVRLPGPQSESIWLPIDAKFPQEDYLRLVEATERGDAAEIEARSRQLEMRICGCARDIHEKYLLPPRTTDFGVLYLPTESLYGEVLRRPGLVERLQRDWRITVVGPTTLAAFLNSLRLGFRTLAIQKRSSEVWELLGAVRTEFARYAEILDRVKKKLDEAANTVDRGLSRTRAIERKLRDVEALPLPEAEGLLAEVED